MAKYLDYEGLQVLWTKIKNKINEGIVASDAMIYKGTIGTGGTVTELPSTTAKTGWTYKVITAGTYGGSKCEIGDMLICLTDGSTSTAATWTVVLANIDGAVTGPASSTASHVAIFNDTTGKVIKDSGYTIATSVPSGAVFTDTKYSAGTGISLSGTTFSNSGVRSVATGTSANQIVVNTNGTNSTITVNNVANATSSTKATQDSSGLQINTTYIKSASASGNTLTLTKGDNTTASVTLPLASTTTNGEMSSVDKSKLDGIAAGAQVNQNSFSNIKVGSSTIAAGSSTDIFELAQGSNVTISADTDTKKVTIAAKDTTYGVATTSANGLMSSSDKSKLDGVAAGAEVNQNAFSNVVVGSTTVAADSKTDTLTLVAGSNVTITPDATNDKITIAATNTDTKVTQNETSSSDAKYNLLLAGTGNNIDTETGSVNKASLLVYNPSNNILTIGSELGSTVKIYNDEILVRDNDYDALSSIRSGCLQMLDTDGTITVSTIGIAISGNASASNKVFATDGSIITIETITIEEINALANDINT